MNKPKLVVVVHNVRSTHNVGSILRSADGFGVDKVYFSGYTPYPELKNDERLPHIRSKLDRQIHKTALGAEQSVEWEHSEDIEWLLAKLKKEGFTIAALEQTKKSILLNEFKLSKDLVLVVGNEVEGLDKDTLEVCDIYVEIPMKGAKESFNVAIATSIAMYHLKFNS